MTSFRNVLETSRRVMVDEDLRTINSEVIAGNKGHTIVCAPLSHISFTIFFLARGEGCADNMNAERAIVERPLAASTQYSSRKDFPHVALNAPSSVSAQLLQRPRTKRVKYKTFTLQKLLGYRHETFALVQTKVRDNSGVG